MGPWDVSGQAGAGVLTETAGEVWACSAHVWEPAGENSRGTQERGSWPLTLLPGNSRGPTPRGTLTSHIAQTSVAQ